MAEVATTREVTLEMVIKVTTYVDVEVTAPTLRELFVQTNEGFLGRPNDCSVLTGYANYVAFKLWYGHVCI